MSYRSLGTLVFRTIQGLRTSLAISAVTDQNAVECLGLRMTVHERMVLSNHLMLSKRLSNQFRNRRRPRKNHQPARISVQSVDGSDFKLLELHRPLTLSILRRQATFGLLVD